MTYIYFEDKYRSCHFLQMACVIKSVWFILRQLLHKLKDKNSSNISTCIFLETIMTNRVRLSDCSTWQVNSKSKNYIDTAVGLNHQIFLTVIIHTIIKSDNWPLIGDTWTPTFKNTCITSYVLHTSTWPIKTYLAWCLIRTLLWTRCLSSGSCTEADCLLGTASLTISKINQFNTSCALDESKPSKIPAKWCVLRKSYIGNTKLIRHIRKNSRETCNTLPNYLWVLIW